MTWFQHPLPRPGEAQAEEGRDPGHGEAPQAVAAAPQAQPLPHQGGETPARGRIKNDLSSGILWKLKYDILSTLEACSVSKSNKVSFLVFV